MSPEIPGVEPNAFCETAALVPGVRSFGLETVVVTVGEGLVLGVPFPLVFFRRSLTLEFVLLVVFELVFVFVLESVVFEPELVSEESRSLIVPELPELPVALFKRFEVLLEELGT
jgi:hypothetical protein